MTARTALKTILIVAGVGLLFSGYLSYREVFVGTCETNFIRCGSWRLADLPACVYGFAMFLIVELIAIWGFVGAKRQADAAFPKS